MKLKLLIYILDDNQLDLELMSRALHSDTFEIELFTEPDKFKASLNEDVSMVITDIGIPNFDVCETVERIKQKHEGLYVIVVSGYLDCTMYERLVDCHVWNIVDKNHIDWLEKLKLKVELTVPKMLNKKRALMINECV